MIINFIDKVKLRFRGRDKELLKALHDILGFVPHNLEIYRIALSHKSVGYRGNAGKSVNNERLEFLGDAILEAVVSDLVFHRYERKREGFLTSTRSKIVQRSSLNRLSAEMGLDELIRTNARPAAQHNNIGGNAFEALIGAIYLDRGYAHCKWFVEKRIIGRLLDIDNVAQKEVNFKSKLLEWTQKNRIRAEYKLNATDKDNGGTAVFHTQVVIEGLVAGVGKGFSKKESHQKAAREALMKLRREARFVDAVFEAKEKRTAMEADAVCAVPEIEEIEEALARETDSTARPSRGAGHRAPQAPAPTPAAGQAKPKPQPRKKSQRPAPPRIDDDADLNADETQSENQPAEQPAEDKKKRRRAAQPTAETTDEAPAEKKSRRRDATATDKGDTATHADSEATTTEKPQRTPRPNSRRRRAAAQARTAETEQGEQNTAAPAAPQMSNEEREAVIRKAEEEAFGEE